MMNVYVDNMKRQMEILNLIVGFELIAVGILYLILSNIESAVSWSIFGCMYIVMDKYSVLEKMSSNRKLIEFIKYLAAWLGCIMSTVFLIYVATML